MRAGWRQLCDNGLANGVGMLVMAIALALPATLYALFDQRL